MADRTAPLSTEWQDAGSYMIDGEVLASNTVYAGDLVAINANGTMEPADDASAICPVGIALNTAAAGETVHVISGIIAELVWASAQQSDLGDLAYAAGGGAVKITSTNYNCVGVIVGYTASSKARVKIDFNANQIFMNRETGEAD